MKSVFLFDFVNFGVFRISFISERRISSKGVSVKIINPINADPNNKTTAPGFEIKALIFIHTSEPILPALVNAIAEMKNKIEPRKTFGFVSFHLSCVSMSPPDMIMNGRMSDVQPNCVVINPFTLDRIEPWREKEIMIRAPKEINKKLAIEYSVSFLSLSLNGARRRPFFLPIYYYI